MAKHCPEVKLDLDKSVLTILFLTEHTFLPFWSSRLVSLLRKFWNQHCIAQSQVEHSLHLLILTAVWVALILLLLFVMLPWMYLLFTIFLHQPWKKKKNLFTERIHYWYNILRYQYTDDILLINSSDSSQKYSLKFFFLAFFLKSSNLILKFLYYCCFLILLCNLFQ